MRIVLFAALTAVFTFCTGLFLFHKGLPTSITNAAFVAVGIFLGAAMAQESAPR